MNENNREPAVLHDEQSEFDAGPGFGEVLEALTGFEFRLLRTMRDLVISPVKVGQKALQGDHEQYLGQLRLFVLLIGLQTLLFSITRFYDAISAQTLLSGREDAIAAYSAALVQNGHTIELVNAKMVEWFNLLFAPINAVLVLMFGGLFKFFDRRYTYFGHVLLYVTISNAVVLLSLPLMAFNLAGSVGLQIYSVAATGIQFILIGVFVWHFYRKSTWNGIWKIAVAVLFFVFATLLISFIMWGILNQIVAMIFDDGPLTWLIQNISELKSTTQ